MDGHIHGPIRGRGSSMFDWLMLTLSFATIVWIVEDPMVLTSNDDMGVHRDGRVISLAEYRKRRFGTSEDDSTPPPPCPLAARPFIQRMQLDMRPVLADSLGELSSSSNV